MGVIKLMAVNNTTIIDDALLVNIANAIRAKTGKSDMMTPAQMVAEIGTIGKLTPFTFSWDYPIRDITVSAVYASQYSAYGDNLYYLALGALQITLSEITSHDNLVGWLEYLPDGGSAEVLVLSGLLTNAEKQAIEGKGYTLVEGT